MSLTVFLDSSPLSVLSNPKRPPETVKVLAWAVAMQRAGHRLIVPAIADYEVRRELERAGKVKSLSALNAWNTAGPDRYYYADCRCTAGLADTCVLHLIAGRFEDDSMSLAALTLLRVSCIG
jgi:hypothetical protein